MIQADVKHQMFTVSTGSVVISCLFSAETLELSFVEWVGAKSKVTLFRLTDKFYFSDKDYDRLVDLNIYVRGSKLDARTWRNRIIDGVPKTLRKAPSNVDICKMRHDIEEGTKPYFVGRARNQKPSASNLKKTYLLAGKEKGDDSVKRGWSSLWSDRSPRVDVLVEWFFEHYYPVNMLPHDSAEGDDYIAEGEDYGDLYEAYEELRANFPEEPNDVTDKAVAEIEVGGTTEWVKLTDFDEASASALIDGTVSKIKSLVEKVPPPEGYPTFEFGDDGRMHISPPPDLGNVLGDKDIFAGLIAATKDLVNKIQRSNTCSPIKPMLERYNEALSGEKVSISLVYGRGVRLENTAAAIEPDDPTLPSGALQDLKSVLTLHSNYIMSCKEGVKLVEDALVYNRTPEKTEKLQELGKQLSDSISKKPDLFDKDVSEYFSNADQDIGEGPHTNRSIQVAIKGRFSFTLTVAKTAIKKKIVEELASAAKKHIIDPLWSFFLDSDLWLQWTDVPDGSEFSWMALFYKLIKHLRGVLKLEKRTKR